uniref:Glutathione S-transferase kappa n=1 Tax=Strongyloides stercoralis TaxID=6248 RepID=A0A0K0DS85_STRER
MLPKITLYYDVISPYSWIAFETLLRYQKKEYFDLILKPIFLGGVMKETSNRPPAMVPAKGRYMEKDLDMMSRYYGMKLVQPKDFFDTAITKGTLNAVRFLAAIEKEDSKYLVPASREFWKRLWLRQESAHEESDFLEVGDKIGLKKESIDGVLKKMSSPSIKDVIKNNTAEAIADGAFGAPWIKVEKANGERHSFFGSDRMPQICFFIEKPFLGPLIEEECRSKI